MDQGHCGARRRDSADDQFWSNFLVNPSLGFAYHDNPRGAKTTLTPVADRDPLLDSVGTFHITDSLDRDDMLPIDTDQGSKTCIY